MREIKFRAWDNECKEKGLEMYSWKEILEVDMNDLFKDPRFRLMQYIGVEDDNGKEIYEGDICRLRLEDDDQELKDAIVLITYNEELAKFGWPSIMGADENVYFVGFDNFDGYNFEIEIIGNIYENPELLEEEE